MSWAQEELGYQVRFVQAVVRADSVQVLLSREETSRRITLSSSRECDRGHQMSRILLRLRMQSVNQDQIQVEQMSGTQYLQKS